MTIEELLNRYFEGETSVAEEARLRNFFTAGEVPPHLAPYKPLFAYFEQEIRLAGESRESGEDTSAFYDDGLIPPPGKLRQPSVRRVLYYVSGVAASVLLALGLLRTLFPADPCFCAENYVVVNGRCYTDIHKVKTLALQALEEVATSPDDYFPLPQDSADETGRALVENQLEELRSLFNDND